MATTTVSAAKSRQCSAGPVPMATTTAVAFTKIHHPAPDDDDTAFPDDDDAVSSRNGTRSTRVLEV